MPDIDAEDLIARLSGSLIAADRQAFRKAAEAALKTPECSGEGATYRCLTKLWRSFFRAPTSTSPTSWSEHRRNPSPSKLITDGQAQPKRRARNRF